MPPRHASAALDHIRVLDLTRVRAGPTCCRVLADFGADVIQIEAPPGVDPNEGMLGPRHGYDMQNLHRNKRALALNLKAPEGLAVFKKLVATADVVVENYRPDVKDRLGIGYESLRAINTRIILASISGFGQTGPYAKRAGVDQIAQGMGGLMWVTGEPGQGPMRAGIAVADSSAGVYTAAGILVALAEREKSGEGQWVHTSLLESQIAMMDFQAASYLTDGKVPAQAGNNHPYVTPMGVFAAKDGHINLGIAGEGHWRLLCEKVLGRPEWLTHPDYANAEARFENRPALNALCANLFQTQSVAYWLDRLEAAGIPAGPIYKVDEMFGDPQVRHSGIAQTVNHPVRGDIQIIGQPVTLSRTPAAVVSAARDVGQDSDEILAELGLSASEITQLKSAKVV
jgi:crotonobetainyl-CoA:carnitine CoA-transferase CaiB-like acyl-CoA transferase